MMESENLVLILPVFNSYQVGNRLASSRFSSNFFKTRYLAGIITINKHGLKKRIVQVASC